MFQYLDMKRGSFDNKQRIQKNIFTIDTLQLASKKYNVWNEKETTEAIFLVENLFSAS